MRGPFGLGAANGLDALDRHAGLLPGALAFAALAERQAEDAHAAATRRVQRDGATGTPDEIGCVRAEDQHGRWGLGHWGRHHTAGVLTPCNPAVCSTPVTCR